MRYEGCLQREFSRALRDLSMLQNERRARLAEADAAAETESRQPDSPAANPKTEKAKRTQFPEPGATKNGDIAPDPPQNPNPDSSRAESEAA